MTALEQLDAARASFDRCIADRDRALAEDVLHPDYALVLVQPTEAVMPRERWLAVLEDYVVHDCVVEAVVVDVRGDVATVLHRDRMSATVLGQDRSGVFVITDTWLRLEGAWQLWRRHSTPLSAGVMPGVSTQQ